MSEEIVRRIFSTEDISKFMPQLLSSNYSQCKLTANDISQLNPNANTLATKKPFSVSLSKIKKYSNKKWNNKVKALKKINIKKLDEKSESTIETVAPIMIESTETCANQPVPDVNIKQMLKGTMRESSRSKSSKNSPSITSPCSVDISPSVLLDQISNRSNEIKNLLDSDKLNTSKPTLPQQVQCKSPCFQTNKETLSESVKNLKLLADSKSQPDLDVQKFDGAMGQDKFITNNRYETTNLCSTKTKAKKADIQYKKCTSNVSFNLPTDISTKKDINITASPAQNLEEEKTIMNINHGNTDSRSTKTTAKVVTKGRPPLKKCITNVSTNSSGNLSTKEGITASSAQNQEVLEKIPVIENNLPVPNKTTKKSKSICPVEKPKVPLSKNLSKGIKLIPRSCKSSYRKNKDALQNSTEITFETSEILSTSRKKSTDKHTLSRNQIKTVINLDLCNNTAQNHVKKLSEKSEKINSIDKNVPKLVDKIVSSPERNSMKLSKLAQNSWKIFTPAKVTEPECSKKNDKSASQRNSMKLSKFAQNYSPISSPEKVTDPELSKKIVPLKSSKLQKDSSQIHTPKKVFAEPKLSKKKVPPANQRNSMKVKKLPQRSLQITTPGKVGESSAVEKIISPDDQINVVSNSSVPGVPKLVVKNIFSESHRKSIKLSKRAENSSQVSTTGTDKVGEPELVEKNVLLGDEKKSIKLGKRSYNCIAEKKNEPELVEKIVSSVDQRKYIKLRKCAHNSSQVCTAETLNEPELVEKSVSSSDERKSVKLGKCIRNRSQTFIAKKCQGLQTVAENFSPTGKRKYVKRAQNSSQTCTKENMNDPDLVEKNISSADQRDFIKLSNLDKNSLQMSSTEELNKRKMIKTTVPLTSKRKSTKRSKCAENSSQISTVEKMDEPELVKKTISSASQKKSVMLRKDILTSCDSSEKVNEPKSSAKNGSLTDQKEFEKCSKLTPNPSQISTPKIVPEPKLYADIITQLELNATTKLQSSTLCVNDDIALVFQNVGLDLTECANYIDFDELEKRCHEAGPNARLALRTSNSESTSNPSVLCIFYG